MASGIMLPFDIFALHAPSTPNLDSRKIARFQPSVDRAPIYIQAGRHFLRR